MAACKQMSPRPPRRSWSSCLARCRTGSRTFASPRRQIFLQARRSFQWRGIRASSRSRSAWRLRRWWSGRSRRLSRAPIRRNTCDRRSMKFSLPVESLAQEIAQRSGSPVSRHRHFARAREGSQHRRRHRGAHSHARSARAGTLEACSVITAALKSVSVRTCGYSGLMLPVLEDPLLAQRAGENRYSIRDLLLFSSVCGTGLGCRADRRQHSRRNYRGVAARCRGFRHSAAQAAFGTIVSGAGQEGRRARALHRSAADGFGGDEDRLTFVRRRDERADLEMRAARRSTRMNATSAATGM